MIQSQTVLKRVVENLDLQTRWSQRYANGEKLTADRALALLKEHLELRPVRNTSLIDINVFDELPREAAELANAIADSYQQFRLQQVRAAYEKAETTKAPDWVVAGEPRLQQVELIERAVPPVRPARPNRPLNLFIGVVLGIILGFGAFAAMLLWLSSRSFAHKSGVVLPPITLTVAIAFGGTTLIGFLCEALGGHVLGSWLIVIFVSLASASTLMVFLLRRFADAELRRVSCAAGAWLAFLSALPVSGFAVLFLTAFFSEHGGWNPNPAEAVLVPLTLLGAILLPVCGWRLWRAARVQTEAPTVSGHSPVTSVATKQEPRFSRLAILGAFWAGLATLVFVLQSIGLRAEALLLIPDRLLIALSLTAPSARRFSAGWPSHKSAARRESSTVWDWRCSTGFYSLCSLCPH